MEQQINNQGCKNTIELQPTHAPITLSISDGYRYVATNIDAHGRVVQLSVPTKTFAEVYGTAEQSGWATFPVTHTVNHYNAKVSITDETSVTKFELRLVDAAFPIIQTLSDEKILIVSSRCRRHKDGTPEKNAKIYLRDGSLETEFCLGDGINDVQVDCADRLWVSYFDEGIFGNFGWGGYAEGDFVDPIGSSGLECFDKYGKRIWSFSPPDGFDVPASVDALNVLNNSVWIVYYTDFPIVKIDQQNRITGWSTNLSGTNQIAISGDFVLAYGGYAERNTDCILMRLYDGSVERLARIKIQLPLECMLQEGTVIGRGELLHVITADKWFKLKVPSY